MTNKVAIVTGAGSGIGRATAIRFSDDGASVVLVGRRRNALEQIAGSMPSAMIVPADVTHEAEAKNVIEQTVDQFGGIDILVNAAGILVAGSIETTTLAAWDETMNVNLRAAFHMTALAVPHLEARSGNIVNVSSVTGPRSFPGILAYCVSKAGLDQLTRCAALELASKGIRVNAVNPGVVVTEAHQSGGMTEEKYQAFLEHSRTTHPLGRVAQAEEIADLIAFLVSERASWITGATYAIDGGRALTCAR